MVLWWPEQRTLHSERMLAQELTYLNADFRRSLLTSDTVAYAQRFMKLSQTVFIEWTGLAERIAWFNRPPMPSDPSWVGMLKAGYRAVADFVQVAMTITQVFAVRLAVLTLAMPAFLLFGVVALVEGLVQRDLRRWGGGRESAFVYHHAKRMLFPSLLLAWIVYLGLPCSVHPSLVILPLAGQFALVLGVIVRMFKKHL